MAQNVRQFGKFINIADHLDDINMNRRKKLADDINNAISKGELDICLDLCFLCIYGLPMKLQINLCVDMLRTYLSIFENRNGDIKSPRVLLNGVEDWVRENGMVIGGQDGDFNTADNAFMYSLESLPSGENHLMCL